MATGTELDRPVNYPDWLSRLITTFNRYTTCENEWELIDIAAELQREPDLPRRLNILYRALQDGFAPDAKILAGNFLILGYFDAESERQVLPWFIELGRSDVVLRQLTKDRDSDVVRYAYDSAQASAAGSGASTDQGTKLTIQIPYFIHKQDSSARNLSYTAFQQLFNQAAILFTEPRVVRSNEQAVDWLQHQKSNKYVQRFLITITLSAKNGIGDTLNNRLVADSIGYLIGAFLTWAGLGVADSTRWMMAKIAVKLAHFSHEFLKPFGKLRLALDEHKGNIPPTLQLAVDEVLQQVEVLDIGSIFKEARSNTKLNPSIEAASYSLQELLTQAIKQNCHFSDTSVCNQAYDFVLKVEDQNGKHLRVEILGLDASLRICFDVSYFHRVVRNLLRNAAQHAKGDLPVIKIEFEKNNELRRVVMRVTHFRCTIDSRIRRRMFRVPIPTSSVEPAKSSNGLGLWTIGMMFEAERLPVPTVEEVGPDTVFAFIFPMPAAAK